MSSCFNRPARRVRSRKEVEREQEKEEKEEEGAGTGNKARMLGRPETESILDQRQEQKTKRDFLFQQAERLFFSGSFSGSGSSLACRRWKRRC